ncbi:MAG: NAD(P)-dependent oxidoreductase [Chthoniobacterales bacterium]
MWKLILLGWLIYAIIFNLALIRKPPRPQQKPPIRPKPPGPMRLLVIGATGGTGKQLVQQALAQGHHVTALVRTPAKVEITHACLRVLRGDVLDEASLETAMLGQDAVLSALGHIVFYKPTTILSEGTRNIMRAMKSCEVRRFVCESSLGVGDTVGRLGLLPTLLFVPLVLPFYVRDRLRKEELITRSKAEWIIVRPTVLTNGAATSKYQHGLEVGNYFLGNRVSRADVADFMLKQLRDDTYVGTAVGIV